MPIRIPTVGSKSVTGFVIVDFCNHKSVSVCDEEYNMYRIIGTEHEHAVTVMTQCILSIAAGLCQAV